MSYIQNNSSCCHDYSSSGALFFTGEREERRGLTKGKDVVFFCNVARCGVFTDFLGRPRLLTGLGVSSVGD